MASCSDCLAGGKLVGEPRGRIETLAGLETYIAEPKGDKPSSKAIILCVRARIGWLTNSYPDIFGLSPNAKLISDGLAGMTVYCPDGFLGEAVRGGAR